MKTYVIIYKDGKGNFKVARAFQNVELMEYWFSQENIKPIRDIVLNEVGYYIYEVEQE